MSLTQGLISGGWLWAAALFSLLMLLLALRSAPWPVLAGERRLQHLLFGATVSLMLMWTMRAGVSPGLGIHFLGMTTLALMFGWDLAILSGTLALLGMTVIGHESWDTFSVNVLCSVIVPALASIGVLRLVEAKLPRNFFVYLFMCAFFGAGVATAAAGMVMALLLWFDGVYPWGKIYLEYVRFLPLIMFPEGLLNGIIMTAMMAFHPDWIRTFDARLYIDEQ
ncbi:energy-coupling factor ABC transporter permease [Marinobacterium weihaiense]|uniref:Energy-coupling factor ABC transporter permease n=1 Tax=Marinobacterium weihaiense TaxID=2851016 RepID=A0ABS6M880_9GAMM|nr:energy-coupling factor ABC transporter permease [Marinobacterium weihaiense]MBV0932478.1 energy-coupling factor ABC transporter permease [Marinobacterium weihaiense]